MKRLFLFLSLFGVVNLQAAHSHPLLDEMEKEFREWDAAQVALDREQPTVKKISVLDDSTPVPIELKGTDGKIVKMFDVRQFRQLREALGAFGRLGDPLDIQYHSKYLNHVNSLYNDKNPFYELPMTSQQQQNKQEEEKITLEGLLDVLDFLGAEDYLQRVYIAWLNQFNNRQKAVLHNVPVSIIFHQMGINSSELEDILEQTFALAPEDVVNRVDNEENREHRYVSIGYLKATGQLPDIKDDVLDLRNKNLGGSIKNSDLRAIPGIKWASVIALGGNQLTSVDLSKLPSLTVLAVGNNQLASVKLSKLPRLRMLVLGYNKLTSVDLSELSRLEKLDLINNQLKEFTLSGFPELQSLDLSNNQLTSVDLSELPKLQKLDLSNNPITPKQLLPSRKRLPHTVEISW